VIPQKLTFASNLNKKAVFMEGVAEHTRLQVTISSNKHIESLTIFKVARFTLMLC
jgi:hypothetical protein